MSRGEVLTRPFTAVENTPTRRARRRRLTRGHRVHHTRPIGPALDTLDPYSWQPKQQCRTVGLNDTLYESEITTARLSWNSRYGGMFLSGFGFAASYYGLPDIGFIAWPDMVSFVQRLRLAFPQQHLLVDIDDGYVGPEVACHVVEHLERIGASGVILEEQTRPRRCGHVTGKQILPIEECQILLIEECLEKLNLVLQDRSELVVGARTDATEESEILRRAEMPAATDADVLLVDGVRSVEWIRKVRGMVGSKPLLFNQIAGGLSPRLSLTGLEERGINVAIYSTPLVRRAHRDGQRRDRTAHQRWSTCQGNDR